MIKAILFDMDGTLVDSERYYTTGTYTWMKRLGYTGDLESMNAIVGLSMPQTYDLLNDMLDEDYGTKIIERVNLDYFEIENPINYREYVFEETKDVLEYLKAKGYKMALCSASSKETIERFIKEIGLDNIFDIYLSCEKDIAPKPSPEIYLKAMEMLDAKSDEVIIVEDSKSGIQSAKSSGAYTIARKSPYSKGKQGKADKIIESLEELKEYL